jgi:hypothetical protein
VAGQRWQKGKLGPLVAQGRAYLDLPFLEQLAVGIVQVQEVRAARQPAQVQHHLAVGIGLASPIIRVFVV